MISVCKKKWPELLESATRVLQETLSVYQILKPLLQLELCLSFCVVWLEKSIDDADLAANSKL